MKASIVVGGTFVWAASVAGVVAYHVPYYSSAVSLAYHNNWTSPITRSLYHVKAPPEHRAQDDETLEGTPDDYSLDELFPSVNTEEKETTDNDQETTTETDDENADDENAASELEMDAAASGSGSPTPQDAVATTPIEAGASSATPASAVSSATPASVAASTTAGAGTAAQTSAPSSPAPSSDPAPTTPVTIFLSSEDGAEVVTVLTPSSSSECKSCSSTSAKATVTVTDASPTVPPARTIDLSQFNHPAVTEYIQHDTQTTIVTSPYAVTQIAHHTTTATDTVSGTACINTIIDEGLCSSIVFDGQIYGAAPTVGPMALLYGGGMLLNAMVGVRALL